MKVSDNTIAADFLGRFFENLGRSSAKSFENLAENVYKNPSRAIEIVAKAAIAAASKNPEAPKAIPDVVTLLRRH